jgi:hypothetical protein
MPRSFSECAPVENCDSSSRKLLNVRVHVPSRFKENIKRALQDIDLSDNYARELSEYLVATASGWSTAGCFSLAFLVPAVLSALTKTSVLLLASTCAVDSCAAVLQALDLSWDAGWRGSRLQSNDRVFANYNYNNLSFSGDPGDRAPVL